MTDEKKTDQKKHEEQLAQLGKTLRSAIPPLREAQPQRDLWPRMLRRMEGAPKISVRWSPLQWIAAVPWFDWALLGAASAAMFFFPALIPALLYHL